MSEHDIRRQLTLLRSRGLITCVRRTIVPTFIKSMQYVPIIIYEIIHVIRGYLG